MNNKIVYTSDLHGNDTQYTKLIKFVKENKIKNIILGGDLFPKYKKLPRYIPEMKREIWLPTNEYITFQREYIKNEFLEYIKELNKFAIIYILMGNDDCLVNMDVLLENEKDNYFLIHNKRLQITNDKFIVGYSYTPWDWTPEINDWNKFDITNPSEDILLEYKLRKERYTPFGRKSTINGWEEFLINPETENNNSIQLDLMNELFHKEPENTIYVIHVPPTNANLDITYKNTKIGSFAVKQFIDNAQPYLTLHGHVHESYDMTNIFKTKIDKTLSCISGNKHDIPNLALILIDIYNLNNVNRIII